MAEAVARGRIIAPGFFSDPAIRAAWLGSEWIGPTQGQLDPVKEITAEQLACENGFSTREQSTIRLNGGSFEANAEQLVDENARLAQANAGAPAKDPMEQFIEALLPRIVSKLHQEGGDPHESKDPTD